MSLPSATPRHLGSHVRLPGFGPTGAAILRASRVHVVGAGAIGMAALRVLARAGVGCVVIDDAEKVSAEEINLGVHPRGTEGRLRAIVAREELLRLADGLRVGAYASALRPTAVIATGAPALVAASADRARSLRVAHVSAEAGGRVGRVLITTALGPCHACGAAGGGTLPSDPPAPGLVEAVGAIAASEALLILVGFSREPRARRILLEDGLASGEATRKRASCRCV